MPLLKRTAEELLTELIQTRPLTYVSGGRQVGKSTLCDLLVKKIAVNKITFDSPLIMAAAKHNPKAFIDSLPRDRLNYIDEVQKVPELFPYLKMYIDEERSKGNGTKLLLLTGSANLMALPKLSDALVGRLSVLTLYPLTSCELYGKKSDFIGKLFTDELSIKSYPKYNLLKTIKNATYPEIAVNDLDRPKWFDDYLTTVLNLDIRSFADLRNPEKIIMLLAVLSMRVGGLLNNAAIASELGLDHKTYERFFAMLLNSFLIFTLKPWTMPNKLNKRFTKAPKLYFTDCNLLSYIMKRELNDLYQNDPVTFGHLLENFVAAELLKNCAYNQADLSYFRTAAGKEVDFVVENKGEIVGIEVKSNATLDRSELKGLIELKNLAHKKFKRGLLFYTGNEIVPLDTNIYAVPICYLWK